MTSRWQHNLFGGKTFLLVALLLPFTTTTLRAQPTISAQPGSTNIPIGWRATFSVTASGSGTLHYQWYSNGVVVTTATSSSFTINNVKRSAAGTYQVVITNSSGTVTSDVARLTISPVRVWGDNTARQFALPLNLSNVTAIASGSGNCIALRADGSVLAWGRGDAGQTNVPSDLTNAIAIAAYDAHALALRADGTVAGWGTNYAGELTPPAFLTNATAISIGLKHSVALRSNGTVVAWGTNDFGQLDVPPMASNIVAIACGAYHSTALRQDGVVFVWGHYLLSSFDTPDGLANVIAIASGTFHNLALRADGRAFRWGSYSLASGPYPITNVVNGIAVFAGADGSFALRSNGTATNEGAISGFSFSIPTAVTNPIALACGYSNAMSLESDGRLALTVQPFDRAVMAASPVTFYVRAAGALPIQYQWRYNGVPIDGATNNDFTLPSLNLTNAGGYDAVVSNTFGMVTSRVATLTVQPHVQVAAWGENGYGAAWVPQNSRGAVDVKLGGSGGTAVQQDGRLVTWGGRGSWFTNLPANFTNVLAVAPSSTHITILTADGRVKVYPDPSLSAYTTQQLANAIDPTSGTPLTSIISIAAGPYYSLALRSDGLLVRWGDSFRWPTYYPSFPTYGVTGVKAIAASPDWIAAVRTNGTVSAWTDLPPGHTNSLAGVTNAVSVAVGTTHGLVLGSDGKVVAWGYSGAGQTNVPPSLSNVVVIACGGFSSLALTADKRVVGWGENSFGMLNVPFGLTNVVGIAADGYTTAALVEDGPLCISKQPKGRTAFPSTSFTLGCTATGVSPLAFRWQRNGADISGATNSMLPLNNFDTTQTGDYRVIVTNTSGSVTSQIAHVDIGPIAAWGLNYDEVTEVPPGVTNPTALSPMTFYLCGALNPNGTVTTWGNDSVSGKPDLSNVVSFAIGASHIVGLHNDGTVTTVSAGAYGASYGQTDTPPGLSNASAVAAGDSHSVALKQDGTVVGWGYNPSAPYGPTNVPSDLSNVTAIACGLYHSMTLKSDGRVVVWGETYPSGVTNVPATLTNAVAIAGAANADIALTSDGTLVSWGLSSSVYPPPAGLSNVVAMDLVKRDQGGIALRADGTIVTWGIATNVPAGVSNVVSVAGGYYMALAKVGDGRPTFVNTLRSRSVLAGTSPRLPAFAVGAQPVTYQWQFNGGNIAGQTNATLTLDNVPVTIAGHNRVIVSNAFGVVTGAVTTVTVTRDPLRFDTGTNGLSVSNGVASFRLIGLAGAGPVIISSSTNLIGWQPIYTNPPVVGALNLTGFTATNSPGQYYRAMEGP